MWPTTPHSLRHVKGVEEGKGMLFFLASLESITPDGLPWRPQQEYSFGLPVGCETLLMLPVLSFLGKLAGSSCNSLDMYWLVGLSEAVGAGCITKKDIGNTYDEIRKSISFRFVSMSMMLSKERGWHFIILLRIYNTPSGLPATSSLTCFLTSDIFKNWPSNFNSSPKEVTLCPIDKQNVYCHLLCDLVRRDEVISMKIRNQARMHRSHPAAPELSVFTQLQSFQTSSMKASLLNFP
ncbi:hypothetical protein YC2023_098206 [Brassica napus]